MKKNKKCQENIDIVITWVDNGDEKWNKLKNKYSKNVNNSESANLARFRNWDNLKYVFRSIELYMPFVRNVFLVTCGQIPDWINKSCSKLKLVFHEDFIPKEYLPTFSSHTIELNLHRIKELSEKFIYFNDDIFALQEMQPKDFFVDGLPCDNAILHVHCEKRSSMIHTIANNDVAVINDHFLMQKVIKDNHKKWFNLKYGIKNNMINLIFSKCPRFPGFRQYHMANSFLKSTFEEVWKKEYSYLNEVCLNKFRTRHDVNQWVIREWQLAKNKFYPYPKYKIGKMIDFEKGNVDDIINECESAILKSNYKLICINDGDTISNFSYLKDRVNHALEKKFPKKSSFER